MTLHERSATDLDEDWLWRAYKTLLRPSVEAQWGWDEKFQTDEIFGKLILSKFRILSINKTDVAAYLVYDEPDHYYLKMIFVLHEFQGRRIGQCIIENLKSLASNEDKHIKLSVINTNPVVGFYEKLGFTIVDKDNESTYCCWGL